MTPLELRLELGRTLNSMRLTKTELHDYLSVMIGEIGSLDELYHSGKAESPCPTDDYYAIDKQIAHRTDAYIHIYFLPTNVEGTILITEVTVEINNF